MRWKRSSFGGMDVGVEPVRRHPAQHAHARRVIPGPVGALDTIPRQANGERASVGEAETKAKAVAHNAIIGRSRRIDPAYKRSACARAVAEALMAWRAVIDHDEVVTASMAEQNAGQLLGRLGRAREAEAMFMSVIERGVPIRPGTRCSISGYFVPKLATWQSSRRLDAASGYRASRNGAHSVRLPPSTVRVIGPSSLAARQRTATRGLDD